MYKIIGGDGNEYGPVSAETMRQWIAESRVNGETKVRGEMGDWQPLAEFSEFAVGLGASAQPQPQAQAAAGGAPAPFPPADSR
ncbi:MAG: GYF domain-containing protein, partial [Verrucomicrobia bacterium]|nr:GYF domain-containing protein [Verrucomicrobiota bacterium]